MNKYREFQKASGQDAAVSNLERQQMEQARMHKPGYRRKMRRRKNKQFGNRSR